MTRSRYRFLGTDAPYFLTLTVNNWLPVFTRPETVEVIFDGWRYLREHHGFDLNGYVILENHIHPIARAGKGHSALQVVFRQTHPGGPASASGGAVAAHARAVQAAA